jgi:hypothetical protein
MHRAPPVDLRRNSIFSFQCASAAQHGRPLGKRCPFQAVRYLLPLQSRFFLIMQSRVQVLDLPCAEQGLRRRHSRFPIHLVTDNSELERPHIFQGTRVVVRHDTWYLFGRHDEAATQGTIFVELNHLSPNFSRGLLCSVSQRCHQRQRAHIVRQGSDMGPVRHLSAE